MGVVRPLSAALFDGALRFDASLFDGGLTIDGSLFDAPKLASLHPD